ncbi:T9SS type A sorting domain-containing protein [Aequorivita sediminis]|uniref:T9SS type A sorting domain-containing protein n=1 Tax=Aequorivita sediminis TaxID=3073653 RepID=UPI0033907073
MEGWCIDSHTTLKEVCALNIEDETIQTIKIYPNPVYDVLNINSNYDLKSVQIFNTMGQKVFSIET